MQGKCSDCYPWPSLLRMAQLVGCSEAPNKGPCPSGYVEFRQLACGRRNLCKSEFTREMKPTRGQLPELRNRQGPRRSPEEQGAGMLGNGRCNRSMALTGFALLVMAITRRGDAVALNLQRPSHSRMEAIMPSSITQLVVGIAVVIGVAVVSCWPDRQRRCAVPDRESTARRAGSPHQQT